MSLSCGEFPRRGDSLKSQSKRNLKIKAELTDQRPKKVPKREPNKQRLPRTLILEPAWKEKDTTWSKSCGASWVDNGSKQRARKATPTSRMALGTGMEAKCNNMEQKANKYCFYYVFASFWGRLGLTRAPQREPEKATRAPRSALGTGMEAKCNNMEPKAKHIDFAQAF